MLLAAENLGLRLGERMLFQGLSFSVEPGQVWAITGPSGAGKSSLLRVLTGELSPTEGVVRKDGLMGEIPQGLAVNEELSVERNMQVGLFKGRSFFGSLSLLASTDERIEGMTKHFGLKDPLQKLKTLSGGEKQRVAVARAVLEDWKLLLADEPISQLDDENARKVLNALKDEASRRGGSLILVLHHRSLADEIATHQLRLGAGK